MVMGNWQEPVKAAPRPRVLRWCRVCKKETAHQLREGAGLVAKICVPCLERGLHYELDRD